MEEQFYKEKKNCLEALLRKRINAEVALEEAEISEDVIEKQSLCMDTDETIKSLRKTLYIQLKKEPGSFNEITWFEKIKSNVYLLELGNIQEDTLRAYNSALERPAITNPSYLSKLEKRQEIGGRSHHLT